MTSLVYIRRRGTAIVDTRAGILVVSKDGVVFTLPGGGARQGESRRDAAIRELKEETDLDATGATYLFEFLGLTHAGQRGGIFRNAHKVFIMTAKGVAKPSREIKSVAYYTGSRPALTFSARRIIDRYRATVPTEELGRSATAKKKRSARKR